jgi:hypothetical protein
MVRASQSQFAYNLYKTDTRRRRKKFEIDGGKSDNSESPDVQEAETGNQGNVQHNEQYYAPTGTTSYVQFFFGKTKGISTPTD